MQISVVIPTFQRPLLLRNCLQALQLQLLNKKDFEVLVISDGPDDKTAAEARAFSNLLNIRYLALPEKKGPAAARNLGWLSAKAPLIAFTDDDCLPESNFLAEILKAADSNQKQAFTGRVIVPRSNRPTDYELNTAGLETADFVTANCVCTKQALLATGGFDERFGMAWREDSDLEFKLITHGIPVKRLTSAIVIHPVREVPWGISIKEQKKTLFNALLYRKYPELYRSKIQARPPVLYYLILVSLLIFSAGLGFHKPLLMFTGGAAWSLLTLNFVFKRLYRTRRSHKHILEMVMTSLLIPVCSLYWQWYGAIKYRVLFL